MTDYYNGFDANARAEKNRPGVQHSIEVLEVYLQGVHELPPGTPHASTVAMGVCINVLKEEKTRIDYLIAEMSDA